MKRVFTGFLVLLLTLALTACMPSIGDLIDKIEEKTEPTATAQTDAAATPTEAPAATPTEAPDATPTAAAASVNRLDDQAGLLTSTEQKSVRMELDNASDELGIDLVIVTTDSTGSKTLEQFTQEYYDNHGYSGNGIILLADLATNSIFVTTTGSCDDAFEYQELDALTDIIVDELSNGENAKAFVKFIAGVETVMKGGTLQSAQAQKNTVTFETIAIDLPEGFVMTEQNGVKMAVPSDYPSHTDNITFVSQTAAKPSDYTRTMFETQFAAAFENYQGLKSYGNGVINGIDMIEMTHDVTVNNVPMNQHVYLFFTSTKTVILTVTSVSGAYDSALADTILSIRLA